MPCCAWMYEMVGLGGASDHRQRIRDRSSKLYPSSSGPSLSRREIVGLVCGVAAGKGSEVTSSDEAQGRHP